MQLLNNLEEVLITLLAQYKNITITAMTFNPDIVTGNIDGVKFITDIITDNNNRQYIIVDNKKYYLDQFVVK